MKWMGPGVRALVFVTFFVAVFFNVNQVKAGADPSWMNQGQIKKTLIAENIPQNSSYYDKQCTRIPQKENKYKKSAGKWVPDGQLDVLDGCWTKTKYGIFGSTRNGWYMRTKDFGAVTMLEDVYNFVPLPNSQKLLRKFGNGTSFYWGLYVYEDAKNAFDLTVNGTRARYRFAPQLSGKSLRDPVTGANLSVGAVGVSNNGRYLVVEAGSFFRYDLDTDEILAFENAKYVYGVGLNPGYELSISNDGRYAVVSGGNIYSSVTTLHDLSTCTSIPGKPFEVSGSCRSRDLKTELFPMVSGSIRPTQIVFSDDNNNISLNIHENGKTNRYVLTAPGDDENKLEYLALGDSFSSGEGDENDLDYITGTNGDGEGINNVGIAGFPYWKEKCHLSDRSYPYLLGSVFSDKFRSVACSGSLLKDISNTANKGRGAYLGRYGQLEKVRDDEDLVKGTKSQAVDAFIPGRAAQIEFVQKYKPRVATVGIGGNDIGFADKLAKCVLPMGTCDYASTNRAQTGREISQLYDKLVSAYAELKNASPTTRFYAVGYPDLFTTGGECKANVLLDQYEREYATMVVNYLNKTIAAAAAKAGIFYLSIEDSLYGNNLCSSADKIAVNGLSRGDDLSLTGQVVEHFGYVGNESYHPNQIGHQLMADAIRKELQQEQINSHNPCAPSMVLSCNIANGDKPAIPAYFNVTGDEISTVRGALSTVDAVSGLAGDFFKRTGEIVAETADDAFQKLSEVEAFLHSDPVSLGKFTTDTQGKLTSTITIPANTEPGYHTLHFVGTMENGGKVDYYKDIFVYASENDWDGDGTANQDDKCGFVEPINEDKDEDGTDDACDGFVGDPQPKPAAPVTTQTQSKKDAQSNAGAAEQQAAVVYNVLASTDSLSTVGHVAGTATPKQVNYFDSPAKIDTAPAKSVENILLTVGSIVTVAILGTLLAFRFRGFSRGRY